MNIFCPTIGNEDFIEMLNVFKDEDYVYYLWNNNNGNPLHLDPHGNPSILFEDLMGVTDGDRVEAMQLKAGVYNHGFRDYFGDWVKNDFTPETHDVYDNGEPVLDTLLNLDYLETLDQEPDLSDPYLREDIKIYGDIITDWNNRYAWDLEIKFDLLREIKDGGPFKLHPGQKFRTKYLKGFTNKKAWQLVQKVKDAGGMATPIELHYQGIEPHAKWGVRVGFKIGRPEGKTAEMAFSGVTGGPRTIGIGGQEFVVNEKDRGKIEELLRSVEMNNLDGMSLINKIVRENPHFFYEHPYLKNSIDLLLENRRKNKDIKVSLLSSPILSKEEEKVITDTSYMEYDPNSHRIGIFSDKIKEHPTLEGFITGVVHELYHAFLFDAMLNPETEVDIQFEKTMREIFIDAKKHSEIRNKYAFKNAREFLSILQTVPGFAADLKHISAPGTEKTFLERIIDAVSTFFFRLTGYRLRKEKQDNLYNYVHSIISTFINNKASYRNPENYKRRDPYLKEKATIRTDYEEVKREVGPTDIVSYSKALTKLKGLFNIKTTEEEHTYTPKEPGSKPFKPVSTLTTEAGYGISEKRRGDLKTKAEAGDDRAKRLLGALTKGYKVGSASHKGFEMAVKDIQIDVIAETGYTLSEDARNMIKTILTDIKKSKTTNQGPITVLSEVFICDVDKGIAGTIDLIIIDSVGRIHLYDFKTKSGGTEWQNYASKEYGPSDKDAYHLQLGIYKHMLEKLLNVPVYSMNVVMLRPTVQENLIGSISLDTTHSPNGIDTFIKTDVSVSKVYGEKPTKFHGSLVESKLSSDAEFTNTIQYKLDTMTSKKESDLDRIYRTTVGVLEKKLEMIRKRYVYQKVRSYEEFVNEVSQAVSPSAGIIAIVKYAAKTSNELKIKYHKMLEEGKDFTPQILQEWRDYITGYDTLDELGALLATDPSLLNDPEVMKDLKSLITDKQIIKDIYEARGKEVVARKLVPFYNELRIRHKEELEKKYRILVYRAEHPEKATEYKKDTYGYISKEDLPKYGKDMEEFVRLAMEKDREDLDKLTYETLLKELSVAANDVNEIVRWLDNMHDISDPIASSMVAAFTKVDEKSRIEGLDKKVEVLRTLRKLEELKHKTQFTSEKSFYSPVLETIDNEMSNFLIRPWFSTLEVEERAIRQENKTKTDEKAREDTKAWMDANFKLEGSRLEEYWTAFDKYLSVLVDEKKITAEEKEEIIDNEVDKGRPLTDLAEEDIISKEASQLALTWKTRNKKLYAIILEKWVNPQWTKFMTSVGIDTKLSHAVQFEELKKSEDPMAQFYIIITDMAEEADSGLPYSYRLGFRLPGVAKNTNERIREGQSPSLIFKETIEIGFLRREEDILRNTTEYTDEKGNPKYFLPQHYTARLKPEAQSYDLASIYYLFWESANDRANKQEILPTLEMAKFFVENRKTERRDSLGRRILRVFKPGEKYSEEQPVLKNTSNLSAMLEDWFQVYIYGNTVVESKTRAGETLTFDSQKFVDALNRYTSLNLLALNVVQGIANIIVGEAFSAIDTIAGEYINIKSWTKASAKYSIWFPQILDDLGMRSPKHAPSLLIERFNALNDNQVGDVNFANLTKAKYWFQMSRTSFMQNSGEHWLRARLLFAFLIDKRAYNKNGEDIGTMLDQYYAKDGELKIKTDVDLIKSKWTEDDQYLFNNKFHGVSSKIHGAYGQEERVAAQRYIIGKLAYMYRKFVMPGLRRRYGKNAYSERLQQTTEGNYITTYKFFKGLISELGSLQFALMGENWAALSPHEKANIKRTIAEVGMLISTLILAKFAYSNWDDPDGDESDDRFWAFLAYQAYRLKAELLMYTPKIDEALSLLRSPMASMSVVENLTKLLTQMLGNPTAVYERGPWKGHLKLERDAVQMVPFWKQYYKFRDIEEQIQWFR